MNSQNEIAMAKRTNLTQNFESVCYAKLILTNHAHISFILIVLVTFDHFLKQCNFVHVGLHHLPDLLLE